MKRYFSCAVLGLALLAAAGCKRNNYKVTVTVLRQNQSPAVGFKVDAWVKGKSEPSTKRTNDAGIAEWNDLPAPNTSNQLMAVVHYYKGQEDQPREITYPFIPSDAKRLKDRQYIPNTVTPDPQ